MARCSQSNAYPRICKQLYATAFEIDPRWLIEAAARRQKWIDQAQSLNLYMAEPNGKKLDEMYKLAWTAGLKTTYYLRTTSATTAEKSTVRTGALNAVALADHRIRRKPAPSPTRHASLASNRLISHPMRRNRHQPR